MARIVKIDAMLVDARQSLRMHDESLGRDRQKTPIIRATDSDGAVGTGFSYTTGTDSPSVMALIERTLAPMLIGREAEEIEANWQAMLFVTHATAVGAITSLAMAALDTALWDLRCRRAGLPLWQLAGGAQPSVPVYMTQGGSLDIETETLVDGVLAAKDTGISGAKVKIGKPFMAKDRARLSAVRGAVGPDYALMTEASQSFNLPDAIRCTSMLEELSISWFEEPLPADDVGAYVQLCASTFVPVAVGKGLFSLSQFKNYLQQGGCRIIQADVAQVGGITPWLKIAHLAESYNVPICPHSKSDLHTSLACAVPNALWLEYIPRPNPITDSDVQIRDGHAFPSSLPGLGIDWDEKAIDRLNVMDRVISVAENRGGIRGAYTRNDR